MAITLDGTNGITTPAVTNNGAYTGDGVVFADNTPSNTLVTTTGGNVGIGTSSPNAYGAGYTNTQINGSTGSFLNLSVNGTRTGYMYADVNGVEAGSLTNTYYRFLTNGSERMRIDSSGNLLLNTASAVKSYTLFSIKYDGSTKDAIDIQNTNGSSNGTMLAFFNSAGSGIGSIICTQSATTYATSSDYRLKDITGELTGYKERVMALQPKQGSWKADGSEFRGFLAHEFANQYPSLVNGEKDAVDAEGNPVYQGMQAGGSETIADLVALVKELVTELDTVKSELATLKGTV